MTEQVTLVVFLVAGMLSFPVWFYSHWHMRQLRSAWNRDEEWRTEVTKALVGMGCFIALWAVAFSSGLIAYYSGASWLQR